MSGNIDVQFPMPRTCPFDPASRLVEYAERGVGQPRKDLGRYRSLTDFTVLFLQNPLLAELRATDHPVFE